MIPNKGIDIRCTSVLFFPLFVHPEPRMTKLHLRRPPGFGLFGTCPDHVGQVSTRSESISPRIRSGIRALSGRSKPKGPSPVCAPALHFRHRDEKPVTATPLVSGLTPRRRHRDAANPFRMRFYENCRVSLGPILPLLKFYLNLPLSHPRSFFSSTYKLSISQALCLDIHANCRGGEWRCLP
jgi:hypothetical protein